MKFSEKWLREWVNPAIDTKALTDQLTMAGLELESITPVAGAFNHVIIGKIQQAEQHPKADRLRVCQVNVGKEALLNIVCGAPNARAGIKVAVAMIGAVLPNGMAIQHAKLRDVVSEGMLCSAQELGLSEPSEGIIELPEDAPLGQDLREYWDLNDIIIELGITPNRGDCLSIAGIAREVAAFNHCPINEPPLTSIIEKTTDTKNVIIDCAECGAYVGRVIRNIHQQVKTPYALKSRVNRSGTRAISPVVDITNYVLYELGQPLHAFDLDTLQGDIQVRFSRPNEIIELLDGQTVTLKKGTLVIADDGGAIAIAGVMGGLRTAVTESTQNIFLESAWFAPTTIAGKARQYALSTDAAYRFERGVDPTLQQKALTRAVNLIQMIVGGDVGPETMAVYSGNQSLSPKIVTLHLKNIERLLGISLTDNEIAKLIKSFENLALTVQSSTANTWEIKVPDHRSDISIEADLIEEAARIYGYQRIPTTPLKAALYAHPVLENKISTEKFCETLVARGYHEMISYSFVNTTKQLLLYPEGESLALLNPISSEYSDMRKGLWPGLIEAASYNQNRQINDLRLFEQGTRFVIKNGHVIEKPVLAGLCAGNRSSLHWSEPTRPYDFYDIKGDVEALLALSHFHTDYRFESARHLALHPGQTAQIFSHEKSIGWVGALHPELARQWELNDAVFLFELNLEKLSETCVPDYQKLSKFPSIRRDISFVIDASIPYQAILDCIRQQDNTILTHIQIFDKYQGASIDENQKSLAIALTLQHPDRTLVESEVNVVIEKIIALLEISFSITLRQ